MNIQSETGVYTITEIPQNPPNNEENWSQRLKPAAIGIFSVSLALWIIILVFAIIAVIPLTQLIVGIIHKGDCSMNYLIPIYLIVAGAIGLTMVIISIIRVNFSFHITRKSSFVNVDFILELFTRPNYFALFANNICIISYRMAYCCELKISIFQCSFQRKNSLLRDVYGFFVPNQKYNSIIQVKQVLIVTTLLSIVPM
jgi:hypothetical protein